MLRGKGSGTQHSQKTQERGRGWGNHAQNYRHRKGQTWERDMSKSRAGRELGACITVPLPILQIQKPRTPHSHQYRAFRYGQDLYLNLAPPQTHMSPPPIKASAITGSFPIKASEPQDPAQHCTPGSHLPKWAGTWNQTPHTYTRRLLLKKCSTICNSPLCCNHTKMQSIQLCDLAYKKMPCKLYIDASFTRRFCCWKSTAFPHQWTKQSFLIFFL